jgi:hypothetical protein
MFDRSTKGPYIFQVISAAQRRQFHGGTRGPPRLWTVISLQKGYPNLWSNQSILCDMIRLLGTTDDTSRRQCLRLHLSSSSRKLVSTIQRTIQLSTDSTAKTKLEDTMRCCRADPAETPVHELQGRSQAMLCKRSTTPLIGTPSERHCYTYCGDKSLGSNHTMDDEQHPNRAGDSARSYAVTDA